MAHLRTVRPPVEPEFTLTLNDAETRYLRAILARTNIPTLLESHPVLKGIWRATQDVPYVNGDTGILLCVSEYDSYR